MGLKNNDDRVLLLKNYDEIQNDVDVHTIETVVERDESKKPELKELIEKFDNHMKKNSPPSPSTFQRRREAEF